MLFIWGLFGFFLALSYQCVLRADLIAAKYEKGIETHANVVERDLPVFIPSQFTRLRCVHFVSNRAMQIAGLGKG